MEYEKNAIEILKMMCGNSGCWILDSGGKDSSILKHIALKSGIPFRIEHSHTTVDAPETVYFVRSEKKQFENMGIEYLIEYPKLSMWQLIVKNGMPPTRLVRYCCKELKENFGVGKRIVTGVRKAESRNREENQGVVTIPKPSKNVIEKVDNINFHKTGKGGVVVLNVDNGENRLIVENCITQSKVLINPLIDWDDEFVWWYIRHEDIKINPLYCNGKGCSRIGCIGCPMSGKERFSQFEKYPTYKNAYIRAFEKMIEERKRRGLSVRKEWETGIKVFNWWMEDKNIDGQYSMDFEGTDLIGFNEKGI